jgi:hypothetical protein
MRGGGGESAADAEGAAAGDPLALAPAAAVVPAACGPGQGEALSPAALDTLARIQMPIIHQYFYYSQIF